MSDRSFVVSLPRRCVGKQPSRSLIYESKDSLPWQQPDPQITPFHLLNSHLVLDSMTLLRQLFPGTMWTPDSVIVPTENLVAVYDAYQAYSQCEISLDTLCVSLYGNSLKPVLKPAIQNALAQLSEYAGVSITVSNNFLLHIYGTDDAVEYAKYKLFVLLNHFYGYSIMRVDVPYSQHSLVAGVDRQHLLTIFQQTGVNAYMPPLTNVPPNSSLNEVYLAGDKTQVVVARKLLTDIILQKTESLVAQCMLSVFVRDSILQWYTPDLETIMRRHATFIQMSDIADEASTLVRIMGTTKSSIDNTLGDLMKLCGEIYVAEFASPLRQTELMKFSQSQCNVMVSGSRSVVYGPSKHVKQGLKELKELANVSVLIEQPTELLDFILGKKQGKISKIMNAARAQITVERFHDLNFRIRVAGDDIPSVVKALEMMEDELPAEKSLYIPEVYHKQVIGQGGQAIQMLMRKYNVYMRFANTTKDKRPNAFGDSRSDNVVIRCPSKNKAQIDKASADLQQLVSDLASKHHYSYVKLTRNHRRLLLSGHSNALRDTEVTSGAAIKLPATESRETQFVEISGQSESNTLQAAQMLSGLLPSIDYEFRIPWSQRFLDAVGPRSSFSEQVVVPLFLAMGAHVQAFERVQMQGDSETYSQIVVSVQEEFDGCYFDDISQVITSYLRKRTLDIVDKGELRSDLIVEALPLNSSTHFRLSSTAVGATNSGGVRPLVSARDTSSPRHIPTLAPQVSQLAQLVEKSRESGAFASTAPPSQKVAMISVDADVEVHVPRSTPRDLPARPPMASLHWNRNYDETPIKKRNFDSEASRDDQSQSSLQLPARSQNARERSGITRSLKRY